MRESNHILLGSLLCVILSGCCYLHYSGNSPLNNAKIFKQENKNAGEINSANFHKIYSKKKYVISVSSGLAYILEDNGNLLLIVQNDSSSVAYYDLYSVKVNNGSVVKPGQLIAEAKKGKKYYELQFEYFKKY